MAAIRSTMYAWDTSALQTILRKRADEHLHAALQVTIGLEGPIRVGCGEQTPVESRCILVEANQPHWFESDGWVAVLWLEPHCIEARDLTPRFLADEPIVALPDEPIREFLPLLELMIDDALEAGRVRDLRDGLAAAWSPETPPGRSFHPAVLQAIRIIDASDSLDVSASDLAAECGVSESYLMQLFRRHLGTPIRRFVRWRRVWRAMEDIILNGRSATDAAHLAGFSDLSHLTKVSQQLFAVSPGAIGQFRSGINFHRISVSDDVATGL